MVAKDNQPTLVEDLTAFFADPPWDWRCDQAQTWDKAHGRFEHRHIICSPDLNDWFASRWVGVAQVFRLERNTIVLKSGVYRQQILYGISNLSVSKAPPLRILQLNRDHWGIENRLHWRRWLSDTYRGHSWEFSSSQQCHFKFDGSFGRSQCGPPSSLFRCSC